MPTRILPYLLLLTACSSNQTSFTSMSDEELASYNQTQPLESKVHCVVEPNTSTYIRKRTCRTVADWVQHNQRQTMTLDVLNSPPGFGIPDTNIFDGPPR